MKDTSLLGIKTWSDLRAFIHTAIPGLAVFLVTMGILTATKANLVAALLLAVFDSTLSHINTADGFRRWVYPVLGTGATLLIGWGIFTQDQIAPWLALIPILLGGGLAAANTNTTPSIAPTSGSAE